MYSKPFRVLHSNDPTRSKVKEMQPYYIMRLANLCIHFQGQRAEQALRTTGPAQGPPPYAVTSP